VPAKEFELEQRRLRAAHSLPPQCVDDFQRLSRSLLHGPEFQWLLVDAPHEGLRKQVMAALDEVLHFAGMKINRLPLSERIADVADFEARLVKNAAQAQVVHVIGRPGWFTAARWDAFNARRERLAQQARARLVFWLDEAAIELASLGAPDLWAWRAGVYAFKPLAPEEAVVDTYARLVRQPRLFGADNRSLNERLARQAAIEGWLRAHPDSPDDLLASLVDELGLLLYAGGDLDEALAHWRNRELPLHQRRGDVRSGAITKAKIADVLYAQGQLDEALRIWRKEVQPVFEKLGDVHARAVTWGKIADVLQARGQLDEALRIRREEQIPVFEKLRDVRELSVAQGKIADALQARGQLDDAMRILREEQLPIFERLGDMRQGAVVQGKIADLLAARGQLDEALRIRREEQLPVFEKLGDVREYAIAQGRIADVLQARGQMAEALRIRREVELPVYERLGDVRARAITQTKVAFQLLGQTPAASEEALSLLTEAHAALAGMKLPEAHALLEQARRAGLTLHGVLPPSDRWPAPRDSAAET
jgi:tetratricopeptide (TPR) repeat protein